MQLSELFETLSIGQPRSHAGIQVFPLSGPDCDPRYALLDELMEQGLAEVTEAGEAGVVPILEVRNDADIDALILDGIELRGAKQNRMVNITIIVGAHTRTEIPVSCVEGGRWAYRSRRFESSRRTVASKLRRLKAGMVSESLLRHDAARTDQGGVWNEVDGYLHRAASKSATAAMDDAFRGRSEEIDSIVPPLLDVDANGAIVAITGEIIALDLLDSRKTFRKVWPALLRGYAMDAILEPAVSTKPLSLGDVEGWLRTALAECTLTPRSTPGVGRLSAVAGATAFGMLTASEHHTVHVSLFPKSELLG